MRLSLENILKRVGGYVDQDASATPTGTDLTDRVNYSNRALGEWASSYDWDVLTQEFNPVASNISSTSFGLPVNFRKPMSELIEWDIPSGSPYTLVPRDERLTTDSKEKFGYITGNTADGFALVVPRGLPSGASLSMDIQVYPSSYITFSDISPIPDAEYVVDKVISLVLEARSDSRFPLVKADADRRLATMLEQENVVNKGEINTIPQDTSFVIGVS